MAAITAVVCDVPYFSSAYSPKLIVDGGGECTCSITSIGFEHR